MSIVQTINLNLIPNSGPILVKCDQYDVGEGRIVAKLYDGDTAYTPAAGATAIIQGKKPDGNGFMYDATLSGNTVTADLTNQMSVVAGRVCCQIVVTESDNRTGSFVFFLEVQPSALPDDTEMSTSEYQVIEELLETAQAINENFPYIGPNGHWFYYDVEQGQYVDSGVAAGTSITIGTTTTLPQGQDATVTNTGDNINAVFNFGIPRGEKGDDGEPGQDGADGVTPDISATATADALSSATPTVEVTKTGTTAAPSFKFEFSGLKGQQGEQGIQGETGATGATGNGIQSITKTGTSGLVDTYTILFTNGQSTTFTVTNGQDGTGSGDMTKAIYDSTNAVANAGGIVAYINGLNFDKYLALYGATALSASDLNDVVNLGTYYKSGSGLKSHSPSDIVTADEYTLIVMGAMASSVATDGDPVIQLMVAHIAATDEAKIYLRGFIGTTGSFVDPYAWTSWVCLNAPDVSGKADKVSGATNGDLAGLDSNGNLTDSGYKPSDFATPSDIPDITGKADKVTSATTGDFAGLDANGNLTDSGYKASDFATPSDIPDITGKADKVSGATSGDFAGLDSNGNLTDSGYKAADFANANAIVGMWVEDGETSTHAFEKGQTFIRGNGLCYATKSISIGDTLERETNYIDGSQITSLYANEDLDDVFVTGSYYAGSAAIASSILHRPSEVTQGFRMRVICGGFREGTGQAIQLRVQIIEFVNTQSVPVEYRRIKPYNGAWSSWYKFTGTAVS